MIFKAILSSQASPGYGQVTISFPIPDSDYDLVIRMLEDKGIGSPTAQDCRVDGLESTYPILNRLVTQTVNVDELDYLAKRLDSFCPGEKEQFQAVASKLRLSNIKDFINLTFGWQQATVITDFSDLERAGKDHSLAVNGGGMPVDAFESEKLVITVACWQQNVRLMKSLMLDRFNLKTTASNLAFSPSENLSSRLAR